MLKRRGSLTIWFDPWMNLDAAPTSRRGRQQTYSDTVIQTCLTTKVLVGMALRQTTGFVESLLRLVGLNWQVPDFSTLFRRQNTLAVNTSYRGTKGPLHLLVDSIGIKVEGEGGGMYASTAARSAASGARYTSGSMRMRWRSGLPKSPGATSAMRRCCPIFSVRSQKIRKSAASRPMAPMTPGGGTMRSQTAAHMLSSRPGRGNLAHQLICATERF